MPTTYVMEDTPADLLLGVSFLIKYSFGFNELLSEFKGAEVYPRRR